MILKHQLNPGVFRPF